MRTLLILRHAKTQPDAPRGDRARELIERGHRDAARIGAFIRDSLARPDLIVTSDATRARQTADIVATTIGLDDALEIEPRIYDADVSTLIAVVRGLPDSAARVIIVGHNPGFELLTDALSSSGSGSIHLPTSGLAIVEFDTERWSNVAERSGQRRAVVTPKSLA